MSSMATVLAADATAAIRRRFRRFYRGAWRPVSVSVVALLATFFCLYSLNLFSAPPPVSFFGASLPSHSPSFEPLVAFVVPEVSDQDVASPLRDAVSGMSEGHELQGSVLRVDFTVPAERPTYPVVIWGEAEVNASASEDEVVPVSLMTPLESLSYAKREILRSPIVQEDLELYAPIFRNLSVFRRSYELMERILKVYIYKDGSRPIFHKPELKGIYASEGWFMKLVESNKKFSTKYPSKAHLFYLPYGAHQLQLALYVPDSHNMKPLSNLLKNYVDMITVKYPFWNRSRGADHFLVACHDWGPYTTRDHEELNKNTIKALCNADVSEGLFVRGRDVSLPETTIRTPKRPLRDLGGKPLSRRHILAFFAGHLHGRVRPMLLKYWGNDDDQMKIYGLLPKPVSRNMSYIQHMKSSKFCICPMGYEVNSPRIVEAIYYECVPVIIADSFVLPFDEVLDWSSFSVVLAEKDVPYLKDILLKILPRKYLSMHNNLKRCQKHFLWHTKPVKYDIFHMILHSLWSSRLNQIRDQKF